MSRRFYWSSLSLFVFLMCGFSSADYPGEIKFVMPSQCGESTTSNKYAVNLTDHNHDKKANWLRIQLGNIKCKNVVLKKYSPESCMNNTLETFLFTSDNCEGTESLSGACTQGKPHKVTYATEKLKAGGPVRADQMTSELQDILFVCVW